MSVAKVQPRSSLDDDYQAFFAQHVRYVWKTLRRLGVPERHCEDLAQDVFVAVHRHFHERDPSRPAKAWLFGFAFRVASTHRRRASTRNEALSESPEPDIPDSARDLRKTVEARDAYVLVHTALAELPMDQRAVVVLHDLDEVAAPLVAASLDVPLNTVYSRLRLGRERFRSAILRLTEGRDS